MTSGSEARSCASSKTVRERFESPVPFTRSVVGHESSAEALLSALYEECGLSTTHIELLTLPEWLSLSAARKAPVSGQGKRVKLVEVGIGGGIGWIAATHNPGQITADHQQRGRDLRCPLSAR
jgi:hypothetical protein